MIIIFGEERRYYKNLKLFGFYLYFQNKPLFFEYYMKAIIYEVQLVNIEKSLKDLKRLIMKTYKKHSSLWATIKELRANIETVRTRDYIKFCPGQRRLLFWK